MIELSVSFGWCGSPGYYELFGGAISYLRSKAGFFAYHWVDDDIISATAVGNGNDDTEASLRRAMATVLGPTAIDEGKFTGWEHNLRVLGLIFDTRESTVSMPSDKIEKARTAIYHALSVSALSRTKFNSLLGTLRHMATCIRPARAFLQPLR